ncbi:MAG: hypothetical protein LBL35_02665 [Clostridiales bacterium]|jgi:hypothetical protein|nr:hypothetical protein [Clostridiales bacterium]
MAKYDAIISQAKVALTDVGVGASNASNKDCNLKLRKMVDFLYEATHELEKRQKGSFLDKMRSVMFDTKEEEWEKELSEEVANAAGQVSYCLHCRCASCPFVDEKVCLCEGCLFGAYVVKCQGGEGIETRKIAPNTVLVNGAQAVALERDRKTGRDSVSVRNKNGVERWLAIDLKTGVTTDSR